MPNRAPLVFAMLLPTAAGLPAPAAPARDPLDPRGRIHIPIGIPDTVDPLKTFVEAEGCFSPGCGSYGIYFWAFDPDSRVLVAPTQDGVACEYGLTPEGYLIPWSRWSAGGVTITTSVCEVARPSPAGEVFAVGAKASLANPGASAKRISLPDPRWAQALAAILGHAAMAMNEGAPDVAVVNYNVFNRDGVYVANILQKSGRLDLAEKAIDYFLAHPFNGRVQVEADNPGQILWAMGEHWLLGRDPAWLDRVYPAAAKLAAMIRYCRTTPPPHWVQAESLAFGDALPPDAPDAKPALKKQILKPGACDGFNPNYTEAFDVAGLRAAALLAKAAGKSDDARAWERLADSLWEAYDRRFGAALPDGYGSYAVLWPCRLYPLEGGKGVDAFKRVGAQQPANWRYFPLATAHQGLLAGNRDAAWMTLESHLAHEQMRGWYAFDEGGKSGAGGWRHLRTTWNGGVAMPHGWAIAEMWLLLRDALAFEDGGRLVLLPGVPPDWFRKEMAIGNLPTYFGPLGLAYQAAGDTATLSLTGRAAPPAGFVLRLPRGLKARVAADGKEVPVSETGDAALPAGTTEAKIAFAG